ncbi:putative cytochrome P450 [Aspergillus sclerotiicarbonarius CBS 121057]|uniref:Putative cytochrome P450 n=1 Tax=Aspergillus sclerotiicarbonarius (strain CBS 121057 / IBT 28362) TaxID=1448318 RepID=A0A319E7B4_ASPSB|nr:putative cytochrome P450 [Aspergillus sclerotiicarbonarius CBS 121057]
MLVRPAWIDGQTVGISLLAASLILLLSWAAYLAFFHPLARYPGPWVARFTNLHSAYHAWIGDIHVDMYRCHEKYGDHVRYAPNRLLINTPGAVQDIYSHHAPVKKYRNYRVLAQQAPNTLTMQDKSQHSRRRRVLSQAFSARSLEAWEPKMLSQLDRLCQVIRSHLSPGASSPETEWTTSLDMARTCKFPLPHFNQLAFDTMTSVSFDTDFDTLRTPQYRYVMEAIAASNIRLSVLLQAHELGTANLDRRLFPSSIAGGSQFVRFIRGLLGKRLKSPGMGTDIFSFLQQCKDPDTGECLSLTELSTETATFIIAGSDTTSTTMAAVCHYLTGSRRCYDRVAEEVRSTFASLGDIRLGPALNSCVFLRACIDEALRLSPPSGSSLWREVEGAGACVDGQWLPAGCEVGVGIYSIHHRAADWPDPFHFHPDRWLQDAPARPYMPFSIGSRSCIGKPLALAQAMLTLARLFWEFDLRRADGNSEEEGEGEEEEKEYVVADHVTAGGRGPVLGFRPRIPEGR